MNMLVTVWNRGPDEAMLHLLPQLWFRNTWSWKFDAKRPRISARNPRSVDVIHHDMGAFQFFVEKADEWLFTENETNARRLFGEDVEEYFKDAFHEYVVNGNAAAINPGRIGTKAAAHLVRSVSPGGCLQLRACLRDTSESDPFETFDEVIDARRTEADAFYNQLQIDLPNDDARLVQRQALAGMIWSKQYFYYDVPEWLHGDPSQPPPPLERIHGRNHEWKHLNNADLVSMPDKWEYPWYAAWDLAFHTVALALVDTEFAKSQLLLMTREWYMHPNGQLPAYEWAFGDVNPPVHAWATWRVFQMDRARQNADADTSHGDLDFLERVFHKLMLNFTWWVNRKDAQGRNIFQGGFLGLDNIGVFDRSAPLPIGGFINQADGTSWMAMYCLNLMRIALELADEIRSIRTSRPSSSSTSCTSLKQ